MIDAAERFQAIENVHQNGSLVDKILPSNVSQNGSLVHKILPSNVSQNGSLVQLSDAEAAERFQAIENVNKNGSFVHKILPSNESQVRPLTELLINHIRTPRPALHRAAPGRGSDVTLRLYRARPAHSSTRIVTHIGQDRHIHA